jgi:dUTP pyrophosphatase
LQFARLDEAAVTPVRKHVHDSGVDVFSIEEVHIFPFLAIIIRTGVMFCIQQGYMLEARPKGRHDHLIGAGIMDAGYQGEILIEVVSNKLNFLNVRKADPIAQLILVKIDTPEISEVNQGDIHEQVSERGKTGGIDSQNDWVKSRLYLIELLLPTCNASSLAIYYCDPAISPTFSRD